MKPVLLVTTALLTMTAAPAFAAAMNKSPRIVLTNAPHPKAVPAVPEPGTWLTMLAGFGLIGVAIRGRRSEKATTSV